MDHLDCLSNGQKENVSKEIWCMIMFRSFLKLSQNYVIIEHKEKKNSRVFFMAENSCVKML